MSGNRNHAAVGFFCRIRRSGRADRERKGQTVKISVGGKIAFGIGGFGKDMVYSLTAYYLLYYYEDILNLNPSFVGTILMVARIFDALNDPVMGVLVARTRTRWGRFRPWLFSGTALNALVLYALFAAPAVPETGLMVWFAVAYLLWGVTYTMLDIPYWSMIPAAADSASDREHLAVVSRTCAGLGGAVITVFAVVMVGWLGRGNEREGFRLLALIISVLFLISEIICCLFIKERRRNENAPVATIREMIRALIRNDQAMIVAASIILINISVYITSNLIIYFFKYDYGGADWSSAYTAFVAVGAVALVVGMTLVYPLMRKRKIPNERIFVFALLLAILGYLMMTAICLSGAGGKLILLCAAASLIFAANGLVSVITTVFLAGSVDYGELRTGHRDESVTFSLQTFVVKSASGLAVFLSGIGLDLIGLNGDAAETGEIIPQTPETLLGLRLMMNLLPILGLAAALIFFRRKFTLTDRRMEEISAELRRE